MAGTKRKTGENRWRLEYMYEGERYSQYVTASSTSEADRQLALFVAEVEKGQYGRQNTITFTEFAQLFLDKYAKSNLSETTVDDYIHRLNKYILEDFGRMKLSSIKRLHIQEFANKLVDEYNLSSKTVKNYIKLISSILNKAIEWDYLQSNVADKISIPKNLNNPTKDTQLFTMHPDTYSKRFNDFFDNNNLRKINLKDLRALNESILVNQGIDIVAAAKRLGHLPTTATNYYLDQIPEEEQKASEILENLLPISSKKI